jgi:hypothetical protein
MNGNRMASSSGINKIFVVFSILILLFTFSCKKVNDQSEISYESLSTGFKDPPASARPFAYHWWLGGNVDTARLREEILSLHNAGIAGFTIFEIGSEATKLYKPGPAFLGKESLDIIKYAVTLAGSLGMEVGLNTASSWNAGGAWITPEHAAKSIYFSKQKITAEAPMIRLPFPDIPATDPWGKARLIQYGADGKPVFKKEIAVLAVPSGMENTRLDTARIINVTRYFDPETEILSWKAPPGEWDILRYVCSNSGENLRLPSLNSAGPVLDHYDAAATEFHFTYIIDRLESVLGDLTKTALKNLYMASYEAKGFAWTGTLPMVFKEINGYDIDKFLPAMFDDNAFAPEVIKILKLIFKERFPN